MSDDPRSTPLSLRREPNGWLRLALAGDWLDRARLPGIEAVAKGLAEGTPATALAFETVNLGKWNSGLIVFLLRCHDLCQTRKVEFRVETLPAGLARLIALSQAVPDRTDGPRVVTPSPFVQRVGEFALAVWGEGMGMAAFLGENVLALARMARGRAQFRRQDVFLAMQECGPQALGIVALINFLIGLIIAFVGAVGLSRFGAGVYVADLVAIATVREMGCIMTGIILCGRTGAAFAAQLGTMKVSQEIEAFQTFGISPIDFLVLPRILAMVAMMPLLCLFADLVGIVGGFFVAASMLHLDPSLYWHRTVNAVSLTIFLLGICKGTFFGVVVALTGCLRGMQCGTNAAAVGRATTSAVVTGITTIIAADGLFAVLCNALRI